MAAESAVSPRGNEKSVERVIARFVTSFQAVVSWRMLAVAAQIAVV